LVSVNPYVLLQGSQASRLKKNWRGPMPVFFGVHGDPGKVWRTNLIPLRDGSFRLYLNGEIRRTLGLNVGDVVKLDVQFDYEYRGGPLHPMPSWFDDAMSGNPLAKRGWGRLTPSRQREILRYFSQLKSREAKERNAERAIHVLSGGQGRFMGRPWNEDRKTGSRPKRSSRD
jgi:hypothetical protein